MKIITLKMPSNGHGLDQHAGERGEHRTYQVVIPLPRAKIKQIRSCIAIFQMDDKLPVASPLILPGTDGDLRMEKNAVRIVLWQQVTNCRTLRIQLVCYGDDKGQTFIDNTPVSERIMFQRSLADGLDDLPEVSDNPGILAQLIAQMHSHTNKNVLSALSDKGGALLYSGKPVGNGEYSGLDPPGYRVISPARFLKILNTKPEGE